MTPPGTSRSLSPELHAYSSDHFLLVCVYSLARIIRKPAVGPRGHEGRVHKRSQRQPPSPGSLDKSLKKDGREEREKDDG